MLAEEQFSNVFLEKRNLKDSLIFKLTNETKFKISKYFYKKNIEKKEIFLNKLGKLEVDIFNKKKIKKYNYLKNHETIIKSINEKIILSNKTQEKNFVKKHFHVEKLAKTLATVVAFNSFHSINLLNLRFYLNPYTLNIEPIPTDNAYNLNANIENNYKKKLLNLSFIFTSLYDDEEFKFLFGQSLKQIKSDLNQIESDNFELCKNFESYCQRKINIENISDNLSKLIEIGDNIFTNTQEESNNIEKFDYSNISSTEQELSALKLFDNYIYARLFNNELNIYNNTLDEILIKNITLYSDDVQNSCKIYNKKNCNQKKYSINFNLSNQKYLEPQRILLKNDKKFIWAKINAKIKDYSFDYILRNEDKYFVTELFNKNNNEINSNLKKISEDTFLISGKVFIQNPIIVPVGYNLKIQPNSEVILNKNSYIYINGGNFISDGTDGKITFKPLNDTDDGLTFFQGSLFTHDGDRETLNLGFGKRSFNDDKSFMYGLNVFYDHELDYNHQRGSFGGEIKSSILDFNTNHYFGISDQRTGKNSIKEDVADGYDLEVGAHVPYMPSAKIYAKIFEYEIPGGSDFEGMEYSSSVGIPNSGLNVEVGFKDYGNASYDDQWFVNLTFNSSRINKYNTFFSEQAFERVSMEEKKYDKVRRENLIVKTKSFSVKAGGF